MSRQTVCDWCGAFAWDHPLANDQRSWLHYYDTGKDECPRCQENREKIASDALWNKLREEMGLPTKQ